MTQKDKELLLKDLCERLPYGVKCSINGLNNCTLMPSDIEEEKNIKPYLRPMSSMLEKEIEEFNELMYSVEERCINAYGKGGYTLAFTELNDWLNAHHFDYRGLIIKGLALKALEGMYDNL